MKFFVPGYTDKQEALDAYERMRLERDKTHGPITEKKVFKIHYWRNGRQVTEQVGEPSPIVGERVLAILESDLGQRGHIYLILTLNQTRMAGQDRDPSVEQFED